MVGEVIGALLVVLTLQEGAEPPESGETVQPAVAEDRAMADELAVALARAPVDPARRAEALVEMFVQGGADPAAVERQPVRPLVEDELEKIKAALRRNLQQQDVGPLHVDAILRMEERRHESLGANVVVRIPGSSDRLLVLGAHMDVDAHSPGVLDNWSGCVLLARLYRMFLEKEPTHTLVFVGFADQRIGCLGSSAFAASLSEEELARVDAALTIQAFGTGPPSVWLEGSTGSLVEVAGIVGLRLGIEVQAWSFEAAGSDSLSLRRRGLPVVHVQGISPATVPLLGLPADDGTTVEPARLEEGLRFLTSFVEEIDGILEPIEWLVVRERYRVGEEDGPARLTPITLGELTGAGRRDP